MALLNWSGVDCMTIPYILFWKLYIPIKGEIPYSSVTFLRSSASKKVIKGIVPKKDLTFLRFLYINVSFFQIFGSFFGSLKADFSTKLREALSLLATAFWQLIPVDVVCYGASLSTGPPWPGSLQLLRMVRQEALQAGHLGNRKGLYPTN